MNEATFSVFNQHKLTYIMSNLGRLRSYKSVGFRRGLVRSMWGAPRQTKFIIDLAQIEYDRARRQGVLPGRLSSQSRSD